MGTSSTRRVASSFSDVNDVTAWLNIEGGGKFDVSLSGSWTGVVALERRTPPAGTAIEVETYTANTERIGEFGGNTDVRLKFTTDSSGTVVAELRARAGKR